MQADTLAQMPEEKRDFWARMFRIGNATYCYQNQFGEVTGLSSDAASDKLSSIGSSADLLEWLEQQIAAKPESRSVNEWLQIYFDEYLEGLPNDRVREGERQRGLEEAKHGWPFRRYVLERNDFGQTEFMRLNLNEGDYAFYVESAAPHLGKPG